MTVKELRYLQTFCPILSSATPSSVQGTRGVFSPWMTLCGFRKTKFTYSVERSPCSSTTPRNIPFCFITKKVAHVVVGVLKQIFNTSFKEIRWLLQFLNNFLPLRRKKKSADRHNTTICFIDTILFHLSNVVFKEGNLPKKQC